MSSLLFTTVITAAFSSGAPPPVFGAPRTVVTLPAGDVGSATELETGDINGDGLADVVVTRITYPPAHATHPIGIFLADGHSGFTDGSSLLTTGPAARRRSGAAKS